MTQSEELEQYILSHIDAEDEYLYRLYRQTHIRLLRPRMASGHLQGTLLKMLVSMIRPRQILEIGTYTGYATLSMAAGLPEGGKIRTFEINDELEDFTRPWLEGSPRADAIQFIIGDVLHLLPAMARKETIVFDMAFIDGDKRQYLDYYELTLKHLSPGGYILADNTLWDGHVIDPAYDRDQQTLGIRRFNDFLAADTRVEKVILPLRDGLTLIRKK